MNDIERMRARIKVLADEEMLGRALTVAAAAIKGLVSKEISEDGVFESEALMGLMLAVISYGDHIGIDRPMLAEVFGGTARKTKLRMRIVRDGAR